MKAFYRIVAALLTVATAASLFACGPRGGASETDGGTSADDPNILDEAPAWPEGKKPEPMSYPEPDGDVEYTKIDVTEDMITSSTPYNNGSDVAAKAFDGNVSTFFDGVENGWIKVDLGERMLIGKIGFAPRSGYESRLNGTFYGSVDGVVWTLIYQIRSAPMRQTTVDYTKFKSVAAFRYIKYENTRDCANIAEFEIYTAKNIPTDVIVEPDRELYADGTYEDFAIIPEDQGMTKLELKSDDAALVDNNPSTLASGTSPAAVDLGGTYTVGGIAFISDNSAVGGKFYGVREDGSRDLIWEVTEAPTARVSEVKLYGDILTTGAYTKIEFEKAGACNLAEIRVYSMDASAVIPLTALPFATGEYSRRGTKVGDVDCVALNWGSTLEADGYEITRDGETVYTGKGTSWHDCGVTLGEHEYTVKLKYGSTVISSDTVKATTRALPDTQLYTINNQTGTNLHTRADIFDGKKYYSYSVNVTNGAASVSERSSDDGYAFGDARVVVDSGAHSLMKSCRIESVKTAYIKSKNIVIIAAHWENGIDYTNGKLFLVTGTPGGEFKLQNIWNPLGVEVRDMSIFIDDDETAYLLAAANKPGVDSGANATTYVFKFTDDYTDIEEVTARMFPEMYREMPNIVKIDGLYYFFVSQTAGWYPTQGAYAVSDNLKEGWSELRTIGNTSTFASQSSWILKIGEGENAHYIMHAYRWGQVQGAGISGTMLAPITFSHGCAYYDYFPEILYNSETGEMIPVTYGHLLSQDAPIESSVPATDDGDASLAVDGDYTTAFIGNTNGQFRPFKLTVDLGEAHDITNVQISWYIYKGSEGYYLYKLYGSLDGENWEMICDRSSLSDTRVTKTFGFTSPIVSGKYRYVRLDVTSVIRKETTNETLSWYVPTIYEFKVFGK